MKRSRRVRGRGVFHRLRNSGSLERGDLISCFYASKADEVSSLKVGFAVSGSRVKAVQRNRIKRLMREAFRVERLALLSLFQARRRQGTLLFVLRESKNGPLNLVRFINVRNDVTKLAQAIALKLQQNPVV